MFGTLVLLGRIALEGMSNTRQFSRLTPARRCVRGCQLLPRLRGSLPGPERACIVIMEASGSAVVAAGVYTRVC